MEGEDVDLAALLGRNIDDPVLNISTYVLNLLYNLPGTRTIGNLVKYSRWDLLLIERLGSGSADEVEKALAQIGLKLAPVDYRRRV